MLSSSVQIMLSCYFFVNSYYVVALDLSVMFEDASGCYEGAYHYEEGFSLALSNYFRRSCNCSEYISEGSLQCSNVSQFHGVYQFTLADGADTELVVTMLSQLVNVSANIMLLGHCGVDGDIMPTPADTADMSNTLLVVLLAICVTLSFLLTAIICVTMYKCYQISKEARPGKMEPAPLPEEPPHPALPYEVAFSRVPTFTPNDEGRPDASAQGLDTAPNEGRPIYIRAYDIATIPTCQGDTSTLEQTPNANQASNVSQAPNVSHATGQEANVTQAINQVDVTPSDIYPGYVEQTNHS